MKKKKKNKIQKYHRIKYHNKKQTTFKEYLSKISIEQKQNANVVK